MEDGVAIRSTIRGGDLPFSDAHPSILSKKLDSNFGFGFNLENPSGVRLLSNDLFDRLINNSHGETSQKSLSNELDQRLAQHGMMTAYGKEFAPPSIQKIPALDFWVHLVHGCNLRCFYCYIPHLEKGIDSSKLQQVSFNLDKIEPTLRQLFRHCSDKGIRQLGLKFAGGEPTLNLDLLEHFCAEAVRLKGEVDVKFSIISNGTFLNSDAISIFRKYKFGVSFSADGAESSHDKVRYNLGETGGKEGTWKQLWRNVDKCLEEGIRPYLLYTVTSSNIKDLSEFRDAAVEKHVGYRLGLVRLAAIPKRSIIERVSESLISFYQHAGENQPTSLPIERFVRFAEWKLDSKKSFACSSGRNYFSIDQGGNISTCQMRQDKTYGNVAEEDFSVIHGRISECEEHAVLAKPEMRKGPCTRCEYTYVCSGGCPQHTKMGFGIFDHTSPWCHVYGSLLPHYVEAVAKQMLRRFYEVQSA